MAEAQKAARLKLERALRDVKAAISENVSKPWGPIQADGTRRLSIHRDRAARHDILVAERDRLLAELGGVTENRVEFTWQVVDDV